MFTRRWVHLVVHEEAIRASLTRLLDGMDYRIQAYGSGQEFLDDLSKAVPGCVMLNINMPDIDGLEVQRRMNAAGSILPVIALDGNDLPRAVASMKLGAVEYLVRPYRTQALRAALEAAFERLDSEMTAEGIRGAAREAIARLTPREREVLTGLIDGASNKEIARDLEVSPRTVELHRANLMEKLGARRLSAVIRIAFAAGLDTAA